MKLLLMDRSIGFLPLHAQHPVAGSLLIRPSPLLDALVALFESIWLRSVPLVPRPDPSVPLGEVDERSAQILTMMAPGLKDEAIARALNVSRRTAQKHVSDLMTELGARTRFQAAIRAHERGWVQNRP